jgi:hypothetical protein
MQALKRCLGVLVLGREGGMPPKGKKKTLVFVF